MTMREDAVREKIHSMRYSDDLVRLAGECAARDCDVLMQECLRKAGECAEFSSDYCRIAEPWHRWGYGAWTEIARCVRKAEELALYPADFREIDALKNALAITGKQGWFAFHPAA